LYHLLAASVLWPLAKFVTLLHVLFISPVLHPGLSSIIIQVSYHLQHAHTFA